MEIPGLLRSRVDEWETLSRWERSELARDLRQLGLSYPEIQSLIEIKKSTLATWCRDVELTDRQKDAIKARTGSRAGIPVDTNWKRRVEVEAIQRAARDEARVLISDPMWLAGVILYWCEGAKTRNHLDVANSDPVALKTFIYWVRRYLDASPDLVLRLHLHEGNDDEASRQWWREQLELPDARFHKTFIKPAGTGHRKNHLAHGVCSVRMMAASNSWHRVMAWIEVVRSEMANRRRRED